MLEGEVQRVRWNNDDRATIELGLGKEEEEVREWYRAARKWNEVLNRKEMQYWEQLRPGRPVGECDLCRICGYEDTDPAAVFDNWRVLHGRSAFTGKRRIAGGYGECFF
jgi:trimethyllysine dioxygenase